MWPPASPAPSVCSGSVSKRACAGGVLPSAKAVSRLSLVATMLFARVPEQASVRNPARRKTSKTNFSSGADGGSGAEAGRPPERPPRSCYPEAVSVKGVTRKERIDLMAQELDALRERHRRAGAHGMKRKATREIRWKVFCRMHWKIFLTQKKAFEIEVKEK